MVNINQIFDSTPFDVQTFDVVPDVQCLAHYDYKNPLLATLKGISTNLTKVIRQYALIKN